MSFDPLMEARLTLAIAARGGPDEAADAMQRTHRSFLSDGPAKGGSQMALAKDMSAQTREDLTTLGFEFLSPDKDPRARDRVLLTVVAPTGWRLRPTDHYMYSHLVDPAGNKRGQMGYKSQIGDLWASFHLCRRFEHSVVYSTSQLLSDEDRPPQISALRIKRTERRLAPDSVPEGRVVHMEFRGQGPVYWHEDEDGYEQRLSGFPQKPRYVEVQVVENTFNPYQNEEHAKLPYQRYTVTDRKTDAVVWTGRWLSFNQIRRIENEKKRGSELPGWRGLTWLAKHWPDWNNPLAYWEE